jgi:hypothetical protein
MIDDDYDDAHRWVHLSIHLMFPESGGTMEMYVLNNTDQILTFTVSLFFQEFDFQLISKKSVIRVFSQN